MKPGVSLAATADRVNIFRDLSYRPPGCGWKVRSNHQRDGTFRVLSGQGQQPWLGCFALLLRFVLEACMT